jgi:hypothetical protein
MKTSASGIMTIALCIGTAVAAALAQAQTPTPARNATPTAASASDPEPAVQTSPMVAPAPAAPAAPAPQSKAGASSVGNVAGRRPDDRIELDTTQISGNRELPKVMYVVPWRRADLGDVGARPQKSLLDEALTPVDRDVFRRENRYYAALESGAAAAKTPAPESKDEK